MSEPRPMTLLEGLKKSKALLTEAETIRKQLSVYCADLSNENPYYGSEESQRQQIQTWLQSHHDKVAESMALSLRVAYTNATTFVDMQIGNKTIRKSVSAWILRRRTYAPVEVQAFAVLNDRGLKDKAMPTTTGQAQDVKVRRYFNPVQRDEKLQEYNSEPGIIDRTLEYTNATTPLKDLPAEVVAS